MGCPLVVVGVASNGLADIYYLYLSVNFRKPNAVTLQNFSIHQNKCF